MNQGRLSDKEAAFLAAAKKDLIAAKQPAAPVPAAARASSPPAHAAAPDSQKPAPDKAVIIAERMARLMAEEAEENRRRFKRQRLWFVYLPVGLLILGVVKMLLGARRKTR
jgi:hypothetical protein